MNIRRYARFIVAGVLLYGAAVVLVAVFWLTTTAICGGPLP